MFRMADAKTCTKCKERPAVGKDAYCAECRAQYQKDYRDTAEWRAERRGIIRGIQAMRESSAAFFAAWGGRPFMGAEVAQVVRELPGPPVAPEDAKPQTP